MEPAYAARFGKAQADTGAGAKATPPHRRSALARTVNPLIESTNTNAAHNEIEKASKEPAEVQVVPLESPRTKVEPSSPKPESGLAIADIIATGSWSSLPPSMTPRKPHSLPQNFNSDAYRKDETDDLENFSVCVSSSNARPSGTPIHQKYGPHELRGIGRQCGNRLPPANAVQAMFLYEMQRQTEAEKLFHNLIFENAREKKEDAAKEKRLFQVERRLAQLEKQTMLRDLEQRIYKIDLRIDSQQKQLATSDVTLASIEEKLATLQAQLENLSKKQEEVAAASLTARADPAPDTSGDMQTIKEEMNILFADRDGILSILSDLKIRLTRLEGNTRSLTLQMNPSARSSPLPTQRIPAKTSTGDLVDLSVPKGQGLNASIHAPPPLDRVRSFQPGKPWVVG